MTEAVRIAINKFNREYHSDLYLRITAGFHYENLFRR